MLGGGLPERDQHPRTETRSRLQRLIRRLLDGGQILAVHGDEYRMGPDLGGDSGRRGPSPQGQGLDQQLRGLGRPPLPRRLLTQVPKAQQVEAVGAGLQAVAARAAHQPPRDAPRRQARFEQATQHPDVPLYHIDGAVRRVLPPQSIDDVVYGDRMPRPGQEQSKERSLLGRPELELRVTAPCSNRPQHGETHTHKTLRTDRLSDASCVSHESGARIVHPCRAGAHGRLPGTAGPQRESRSPGLLTESRGG